MIDALLFAVRDGIQNANMGYAGPSMCEIMESGQPPQGCGNIFIAVHEGSVRGTAVRNLDEKYGFMVTLTMRVSVPNPDHLGISLLASKLARTTGKGQPSFNARIEQLRAFLHANWTVLAAANANIAAWTPSGQVWS